MSKQKKDTSALIIPDEVIISKIYMIRDQKVMLDRDLAELYGVETRVLKQAVRRNIDKFPEDFMFELTKEEFKNWRSQIVTSNRDKMGLRYSPFAFTEHGVLMLSNVLNSKRASQLSVRIIRIFIKMRELLLTHKEMQLKIEQIEKRVGKQDEKVKLVIGYLKQFIKDQEKPRKKIGFKIKGK